MANEKTTPTKARTAQEVQDGIAERIAINGGGDRPVLVGTAQVVDVEFRVDETGVDGNVVLITEE